jgi:Flp pilus assembly protein TadD
MNIKLLLLALASCTAMAHAADIPGSNPTAPRTSVSDRLGNARTAIAARDWNRALSELTVAAREEPRNADVHNLLGYSYRKRPSPDITKAFEHYYTALKLDPRHKGAHEYIGQAYLTEKRPQEAEKHLVELEKICGNKTCEEYAELSRAITEYKAKN